MSDYEDYVKKYARDLRISVEEAEAHALVLETKKYYEESDNYATTIQGLYTHSR